MRDEAFWVGRLHLARTQALFREQTHLEVRVQTNLGFCARFATWNLLENVIVKKGRKKPVTVEELAQKLAQLKALDFSPTMQPGTDVRPRRIEFRDGLPS